MLQHKFACPECSTIQYYEDGKFYDGMPTGCLRCGTELVLSREWDEFDDSYKWRLMVVQEQEEDT